MKKIILFGAGNNGLDYISNFKNINKSIYLFCDNDTNKWGTYINEVRIISFKELLGMYSSNELYQIIITMGKILEIYDLLKKNYIDMKIIYFYDMASKSVRPIEEMYSIPITSQDGEEMYLKSRFANRDKGTYVDVGANHPIRFSNTWWAYRKGWRGINIEPDVNNFKLLENVRGEDININCGIANIDGELEYYQFEETALNTFVYDEIDDTIKDKIIQVRKVPVRRLCDIFKENNISKIDYIDIDVEGMEIEVLKSINWGEVSIDVLLIEQRRMSLIDVSESEVCKFMLDKGYIPQSKYNRTVIYEKSDIGGR
jgi:FkbM family methyltransferase